jgi:hypothetical protein
MLKRTKGRILLTLLVTTGLAGTINDSSLSQKERKQAIMLLKNSRSEILTSTSGLSSTQMNYTAGVDQPSIAELVTSMTQVELAGSSEIKTFMEQPTNPELRLKIALTDEQLLNRNNLSLAAQPNHSGNVKTAIKSEEAVRKFVMLRTNHIKYIRTSTEDLRNHVMETPAGWIDCYQYFLFLADQSFEVAGKIKEIKALPGFPSK